MRDVVLKQNEIGIVRIVADDRAGIHWTVLLEENVRTDFGLGHPVGDHYLLQRMLTACSVVIGRQEHQLQKYTARQHRTGYRIAWSFLPDHSLRISTYIDGFTSFRLNIESSFATMPT
jgi:hypothetical protein